jgi:hypothetical protein
MYRVVMALVVLGMAGFCLLSTAGAEPGFAFVVLLEVGAEHFTGLLQMRTVSHKQAPNDFSPVSLGVGREIQLELCHHFAVFAFGFCEWRTGSQEKGHALFAPEWVGAFSEALLEDRLAGIAVGVFVVLAQQCRIEKGLIAVGDVLVCE